MIREGLPAVFLKRPTVGCGYSGDGDFLPDGNNVVLAFKDEVHVYDTATGALARTFVRRRFPGDLSTVSGLAILGADLVASTDILGRLFVWRVSTGVHVFSTLSTTEKGDTESTNVSVIDSTRFVFRSSRGHLLFYEHCDGSSISCVFEKADIAWDKNKCMAVNSTGLMVTGSGTPGHAAVVRGTRDGEPVRGGVLPWPMCGSSASKLHSVSINSSRIVLASVEYFLIYDAKTCSLLKFVPFAKLPSLADCLSPTSSSMGSRARAPIIAGERFLLLRFDRGHRVFDVNSGQVVENAPQDSDSTDGGDYWGQRSAFSRDGRVVAFDCCLDLGFVARAPKPVADLIRAHAEDFCACLRVSSTVLASDSDHANCAAGSGETGSAADPKGVKHGRDTDVAVPVSDKRTTGSAAALRPRALPDFEALKRRGVNRWVVEALGRGEIAELLAAFLVGYRREEEEHFLAARESVTAGLLDAGVFDGTLLVGDDAAVEAALVSAVVLKQMQKDGVAKGSTSRRLERFESLLKEAP